VAFALQDVQQSVYALGFCSAFGGAKPLTGINFLPTMPPKPLYCFGISSVCHEAGRGGAGKSLRFFGLMSIALL